MSNSSQLSSEKGSPAKAIITGASIDIIGSVIIGVILAIVYGIILSGSGLSTEEITTRFETLDPYSAFSIIGAIVGCFISMVSGYVCARIVNYSEYKYGAVLGLISSTFGIILGSSTYSIAEKITLVILTFASVMLGVWVHVNDKAK